MQPIPQRSMKPITKKVAARLAGIQGHFRLSLSEMANLLGLNKSTYNSYYRGLALPPLSIAEKIMELYRSDNRYLNVEWFYYGDIVEYIRDYLRYKGHSKFLNEHLFVPNQVFLMYDIANCGPDPFEIVNPTDVEIDKYFEEFYRDYTNIGKRSFINSLSS